LIGSFLLGAQFRASAEPTKLAAGPNIQESTPEDDKAAMEQAASEADKWADKQKTDQETTRPREEQTTARSPEVSKSPSKASSPDPASLPGVTPSTTTQASPIQVSEQPAPPALKPAPPRRTGLNEMKGKLLSVSDDPKTLRLIVDGGFNVEFTYDAQSSVTNGGQPIRISDLEYNDELIVRYAGKDLYAVEVDRVSKAPRPQ